MGPVAAEQALCARSVWLAPQVYLATYSFVRILKPMAIGGTLMKLARAAVLALGLIALGGIPAAAETFQTSVDAAKLAKKKRTTLGLYLTSSEAYDILKSNPKILLIDVRSRAEFSFVGHPTVVDRNIPYRMLGADYAIDAKRKQYTMVPNVDFPAALEKAMQEAGATKSDPIMVMCRSGTRSRMAVDYMAKLGFTQVYNIVDGFEGDKDKATGHRTVNGWKNSNLPWTYDLVEQRAYDNPSL
jgi:rhodanese-related sulfurtransferase